MSASGDVRARERKRASEPAASMKAELQPYDHS